MKNVNITNLNYKENEKHYSTLLNMCVILTIKSLWKILLI